MDERFELDGDGWQMGATIIDGGLVLWADNDCGNSCAFLSQDQAERFAKWLQEQFKTAAKEQAPGS